MKLKHSIVYKWLIPVSTEIVRQDQTKNMMKSQTEQQRKSILAENSNNLPSNYWKPEIESDWMKAQARPASQPDSDRVHGVMQFLSSANKIITFDTEYSMILWHCLLDAEYDADWVHG